MLNQIQIEGTICGKKVPELRMFPSGNQYLKFYILWNKKIEGRTAKGLFCIVLNDSLAEKFYNAGIWKKGLRVLIDGYLVTWQMKGGTQTFTEIICTKLKLVNASSQASKPKTKEKAPEPVLDEETVPY